MTNYYVKTDGNDSHDGFTIDTAWQHPSFAALQAIAGDTIYLMDGTWYGEHVVFKNSGTATHPITMEAYSGTPTIDGGGEINTGIENTKSYIHISGLKIINHAYRGVFWGGSYTRISNCEIGEGGTSALTVGYDSHYITVEKCKMHHTGRNVLQFEGAQSESGKQAHHISIINNEIYTSVPPYHNLIDLWGIVHDVEIIGNKLHDNPNDAGIHFHLPRVLHGKAMVERVTIKNNNIYGNSRGIYIAHAKDIIISGNTIRDNIWYGITGTTYPSENVTGCGNTFYGNGEDDVIIRLKDGSTLTAEAFTDPCNGLGTQYIWLEPENADYITPDFEIAIDTLASNGKYISIPEGVGWNPRKGEANYNIHINIPGNYVIWGSVIAPTENNNSFFVQFDNDFEALWTIALSNNWQWSTVNHWGSGEEFNPEIDPVIFNLSAGNHILKIKQREDGIKLDRLLITNDLSYNPAIPLGSIVGTVTHKITGLPMSGVIITANGYETITE